MNHYIYGLEDKNTGEFYIGVRSCKCDPLEDKYMGSYKSWNAKRGNLTKYIIKDDFKNIMEADKAEKAFITKYITLQSNKNASIPPMSFHINGEEIYNKRVENIRKYWASDRCKEHRKKLNKAVRNSNNMGRSVKVKKISTGEIYNSLHECAENHDVSYMYISRRCNEDDSDFKRLDPKVKYNREKKMHHNANVTKEEAQNILRLIRNTNMSPKQIEKETGSDYQTIKDMKYKGRYSWVL